jgi:hypothetical protein
MINTRGDSLKGGRTLSCGCYGKQNRLKSNTKHGQSRTKLYKTWTSMIQRCHNTRATQYADYGGRGISVCLEWKDDFQNFHDWALTSGYESHLTIDRINNEKGYGPSNCRWATMEDQQKNKRETKGYHYLEYQGIRDTLSGWSKRLGSTANIVWSRLKKGWSIEAAITTPIDKKRRNSLCRT